MSDTPPTPDAPDAGVPDGTVLDTPHGNEMVVYDYDGDGNVLGWHKEAI